MVPEIGINSVGVVLEDDTFLCGECYETEHKNRTVAQEIDTQEAAHEAYRCAHCSMWLGQRCSEDSARDAIFYRDHIHTPKDV
tara:strand:- start:13978 stop:14226 length:249 start_codon:yes stop_codon:yes gene_type:complete